MSWRILVFILAVTFAVAACQSEQKAAEKQVESGAADIHVTPEELWQEYSDSAAEADTKYKGRVLIMEGVIKEIDVDNRGYRFIVLDAGNEAGGIQCTFAKESGEPLSVLEVGGVVTLKGLCDGKLTYVMLNGCELADPIS